MNVTEQSVMLSSYPSGEIPSARRKADNVSQLLVTVDTPIATAVCGFRLADRNFTRRVWGR